MTANTITQITTNTIMFFRQAALRNGGFVSSTRTRNSIIISTRKNSSAQTFSNTKTKMVTNVNTNGSYKKRYVSGIIIQFYSRARSLVQHVRK